MKSVSVDLYSVWAASAQGNPQLTLVKPDCFSNDSKHTAICVRTRSSVPKSWVLNWAQCVFLLDERVSSMIMLCNVAAAVIAAFIRTSSSIKEGVDGVVVFLWVILECVIRLGNVRGLCVALSARVSAIVKISNQFFWVVGRGAAAADLAALV